MIIIGVDFHPSFQQSGYRRGEVWYGICPVTRFTKSYKAETPTDLYSLRFI